MTAIINASNTSGITFTSDTSGNVAIQSNGTTVVTIAGTGANAGVQMGAAFAPAFGAYLSTNQTISNTTGTVLSANTKEYDTGGCYNNTGSTATLNGLSVPAYSFCPNVAGYYQVNMSIQFGYSSLTRAQIQFWKNGSLYKRTADISNTGINSLAGSTIVYLNGIGDYVQATGYLNATGTLTFNGGTVDLSWFNGSMIRSA